MLRLRDMAGKIKDIIIKINPGLLALLLKIGPKLLSVMVKFAKFFKIGKFGLGAISFASYAYLFTWQFAIMIIVLLVVHEYGHLMAMKRCGLKTKGIYLIPFLGAAAVSEELFKSRRDEAYIAIMGPLFGLVLSGIAGLIYLWTGNALFAAAAGWMAMINLFNLLPVNPLDGGRIMKSIMFSINSKFGFYFMILGIIASLIILYYAGIVLFFFLLIIGSFELIWEYTRMNKKYIIQECVNTLDKISDHEAPIEMKNAINKTKAILLNKEDSYETKRNKIISLANEIDNLSNGNDYDHVALVFICHVLKPSLETYNYMPRMSQKGIAFTTIVYIGVSVILWLLMSYFNNIPEVSIAREFFMS